MGTAAGAGPSARGVCTRPAGLLSVASGRPRERVTFRCAFDYCCTFVTASITRSRLKLPGFWRGGNSRKLCSHCAT
jgi:hypothetical protein